MSKEMTEGQKLAEQLLYTRPHAAEASEELNKAADEFCEGYKAFLDNGKTERDVTTYTVKLLEENGYVPFVPGTNYAPGAKVYLNNRGKSVIAATMGQKPLSEGVHMNIAHTDAPRLDLKPNPLYENNELALLKTHYYGGIRKYQWVAMPLALHGVICKADGTQVNVCIGEEEGDPVFCITDLLPHLSADQNERKLSEGVKGEELNIVVGSLPFADKEVKDRVKLLAMKLLNDKYGITERDFISAELEAVPAFKAKDVGFDRGLIGAYGHDDRVDAYPALIAEMETKLPVYTTVCVLTDKEEIGSEGVTGLNSMYVFHFVQQLCKAQGADDILCFQNSKCLSADVTAAFDPTFPSAFEAQNSTFVGKGVAISKYTQVHRLPRQGRRQRRLCRAGELLHPHLRRRRRRVADRRAGQGGPGRRRHCRQVRGLPQHRHHGRGRARAQHALALRTGGQDRRLHGLQGIQGLQRQRRISREKNLRFSRKRGLTFLTGFAIIAKQSRDGKPVGV